MEIQGAIFDCDGTLIGSLGFWDVFYEKTGERYFGDKEFRPRSEDDKAMRTQTVGFLSELLHEKYGIAQSAKELYDWFFELNVWYYNEVVELKAGVRELLSHLAGKGIKMCIASAAEPELTRMVLKRHGLLDYFEGLVSCREVGAGKDKPDVFLAAEKFLGTPHATTWVFEDSTLAIETAKRAGFCVVGVYDALTFGQDLARELSDEYIDDGGSFVELIPKIK